MKPSSTGYHHGNIDFAPSYGFDTFDIASNFAHAPANVMIVGNSHEEIEIGDPAMLLSSDGGIMCNPQIWNGNGVLNEHNRKVYFNTSTDKNELFVEDVTLGHLIHGKSKDFLEKNLIINNEGIVVLADTDDKLFTMQEMRNNLRVAVGLAKDQVYFDIEEYLNKNYDDKDKNVNRIFLHGSGCGVRML